MTPKHLGQFHDVEEGIENRLYSAMIKSTSFEAFIEAVKTKRYTRTRIQRICANILTHTTKEFIQELQLSTGAPFIRLLGATSTCKKYLKHII